ncbi:unnamed protein product [Notodromas monacha]|uniref:BTB domain-containing protein n=1 Tax=Notodromas monacha TaxID=399045 RepID=A0A7R9BCA9_9CRUS|nr:unnamed protein product [Notodromas monacha]CAG0912594.1 unnamed protein product [Notodromas monacha]
MFTREFRHSGHAEALGKDLWGLRSLNVATDSRLMSGTECFSVHSCVLACNSPYLEHFFQTQTSTNPVFVLPKAEPKSVMHLLEFMYTGETQVEVDQLTEFGELANLLDVRVLKELWPLETIEVKKEISDAEEINLPVSPPPKNRARGGPKSKRKSVDFDLELDSSMEFEELPAVVAPPDDMISVKSETAATTEVPKVERFTVEVPPQFDVMEIMKTQKGNDKLAYKGYVYSKDRKYVDRVSWRCEQRYCKGRATTPLDFEEYEGRDVVTITQLHSHPASAVRVEVLRARTKALNAATGNQAPEEIVANAVAGLSEEAMNEIGSGKGFIQAIKRKRRLMHGSTYEAPSPAGQIVQDCYGNEFFQQIGRGVIRCIVSSEHSRSRPIFLQYLLEAVWKEGICQDPNAQRLNIVFTNASVVFNSIDTLWFELFPGRSHLGHGTLGSPRETAGREREVLNSTGTANESVMKNIHGIINSWDYCVVLICVLTAFHLERFYFAMLLTELISVDSKRHAEALGKDLWGLRNLNVATDSRLMSGTECFPVHSCVLACNSPYLEHFFQTQTSTNPVFVLPKAEPKSVMHLLEFMYTGETQVEVDQLIEFGELANLLDVRVLKELWPLETIEVKREMSDAEEITMPASPPPKIPARGMLRRKRKLVNFVPEEDSGMECVLRENANEVSEINPSSSTADHEMLKIDCLPEAVDVVKSEADVTESAHQNKPAVNVPPKFAVMEIMKSQMGKDKMAYKGYVYCRDKKKSNWITWRCEQQTCKGRATTPLALDEYEGRDVVTVNQLHSHPASAVRVEILRARTKALIAATTGNQAPEEIVANAVVGLSEEALSEIDSGKSFIYTIKRKRRQQRGPICRAPSPAGQIVHDCYGNEFLQVVGYVGETKPGMDVKQSEDKFMFAQEEAILTMESFEVSAEERRRK